MGETTEERRKRLEAKALALREERERLRSDYVDEQMVRRFREGCDDLRNLESHELQRQVVETREQQMQRKLDEAEKQTIKDLEFAAEWEALRQQKILRDEQDLERNKKLQDETIFCLNVQKDAIADRRAEEQRERERMAQEMVRIAVGASLNPDVMFIMNITSWWETLALRAEGRGSWLCCSRALDLQWWH
jgi:hypothetical protein